MGLDEHAVVFLAAARRKGVSFESTATMGRQAVLVPRRVLLRAYSLAGCPTPRGKLPRIVRGWLEPILQHLGADQIVSIDASDYEGATYVHDLNIDIPETLKGRFSAVLDVGTIEHIFNFPAAIQNYMQMVSPGGHLLLVSPANNEAGHGFYQFSPELLYRVLAPAYGFQVEQMLLLELGARKPRWYAVADPDRIGARAQFRSRAVTYLFVCAQRIGDVRPFEPPPQQSDYAAQWRGTGRPPAGTNVGEKVGRVVASISPSAKQFYQSFMTRRRSLYRRNIYSELRSHFTPISGPEE